VKRVSLIVFVIGLICLAIYVNVQSRDAVRSTVREQSLADAAAGAAKEQRPAIGYPAPSFSLKALDGKTYTLDGPRERPLLINFWASWCGPCEAEAPVLKRLYEKYRDRLDLYAVNLTSDDRLEHAKAFVERFQLPFPILLDTEGAADKAYLIQAVPTTFFVDRSGVIRRMFLGLPGEDVFEREIQALLGK
jgi:thiol-disulfide isomerase/thioredoxin